MKKKLTKHGNSMALVIDKPLMKLLNLNEKSEVKITIKDGKLIIEPVQKEIKKRSAQQVREATRKIIEEYAEAFKKLSKT